MNDLKEFLDEKLREAREEREHWEKLSEDQPENRDKAIMYNYYMGKVKSLLEVRGFIKSGENHERN